MITFGSEVSLRWRFILEIESYHLVVEMMKNERTKDKRLKSESQKVGVYRLFDSLQVGREIDYARFFGEDFSSSFFSSCCSRRCILRASSIFP